MPIVIDIFVCIYMSVSILIPTDINIDICMCIYTYIYTLMENIWNHYIEWSSVCFSFT